ncbi:hypothetical protein CEE39_01955 [bacterium (candidate division B38) B3_B38]|nr:MAG: hypothetical protein CEE39_01955 [bacterium (candidate division B38) B3_B38]
MAKAAAEGKKPCCLISELLAPFSDALPHMLNARKELLLAVRAIIDKKIELLEKAAAKKGSGPARQVEVK